MGDGVLVEFSSRRRCGRMRARHPDGTGEPARGQISLRIGINLGDIIIDGEDIYGDGVNVAARLEGAGRSGRHLHLGHGS